MRNNEKRSSKIIKLAEKLPIFSFDSLRSIEKDRHYLSLVLHRYHKSGKLIRLKKGFYTARSFAEKIKNRGELEVFKDFIASFLYQPSYLSLETMLYRYNLLTELPANLTLITRNKTAIIHNQFGNFIYHNIKSSLFRDFEIEDESNFSIIKATKIKALFDFLYLRKNILPTQKAVKELRLNIKMIKRAEIKELEKDINLEGSKKMKDIFYYLFN